MYTRCKVPIKNVTKICRGLFMEAIMRLRFVQKVKRLYNGWYNKQNHPKVLLVVLLEQKARNTPRVGHNINCGV